MAWRYVIDKKQSLVISTAWDRLTFPEAKAHQDQLLSDPDFSPEYSQLVDLRAVTKFDLSVGEAKQIARRTLFSTNSRRALVASDPAIFGMGRLMQAYNEMSDAASQVHIFRDLPSAVKWLGVETPPR